jgi:hypothetical protein
VGNRDDEPQPPAVVRLDAQYGAVGRQDQFHDTLQYEATIEDPKVFERPWVIRRTFPLLPEYDHLEEFVCENNRDYKGLFEKK